MNARLPLLLAAAVISVLAVSARGDTHTNLVENFSSYDYDWDTNVAASKLIANLPTETILADTDTPNWTGTGLVYRAKSSLRLGNGSTKGMVFTPPISLHPNARTPGNAILSFRAARTTSTAGVTLAPVVTVVDANGDDVVGASPTSYNPGRLVDASSLANIDLCHTNIYGVVISQTFTGLPDSFRFKFVTSAKDGRVAIDSVLVTQEVFEPAVISVK
jgi:hypothetical protein